ncbi:hypothetical protein A2U01_0050084, partial [Trifolium medium]|nr:hypothetical protein [Trifolium medium]
MHPQQSKDLLLNPIASISSNEFYDNSSGISDFLLVNELDPEDDEEDKDYEDEDENENEDEGDDEDEEDCDDEEEL